MKNVSVDRSGSAGRSHSAGPGGSGHRTPAGSVRAWCATIRLIARAARPIARRRVRAERSIVQTSPGPESRAHQRRSGWRCQLNSQSRRPNAARSRRARRSSIASSRCFTSLNGPSGIAMMKRTIRINIFLNNGCSEDGSGREDCRSSMRFAQTALPSRGACGPVCSTGGDRNRPEADWSTGAGRRFQWSLSCGSPGAITQTWSSAR